MARFLSKLAGSGCMDQDLPPKGKGSLGFSGSDLEQARDVLRDWHDNEASKTDNPEFGSALFIAIALINNEINKIS